MSRLRRNRAALEARLAGSRWRRYYSPVLYALESGFSAAIRAHARGRVLDAGCGAQPYGPALAAVTTGYDSLDVERRTPQQTYVGDLQNMEAVPSGTYDTVVCSEVLEHVPRPLDALLEIRRVLKPGGLLIVSVPYLARLHEEPHDFYRYTRHGLEYLMTAAAFDVVSIAPIGSIVGFLGHQVSTLLVAGTWHVPGLRWLLFALNAGLITLPCHVADRLIGSAKAPAGYIAVARSPAG